MSENEARAQAKEFLETIGQSHPTGVQITLLAYMILRAYHQGAIDACDRLQETLNLPPEKRKDLVSRAVPHDLIASALDKFPAEHYEPELWQNAEKKPS